MAVVQALQVSVHKAVQLVVRWVVVEAASQSADWHTSDLLETRPATN